MKAVPLAIAEAVNLCHMARDWAYGPGEHQVIDRCEVLLQMAVDELLEVKRAKTKMDGNCGAGAGNT